jgi:hypothetical protein
VINAVSAMVRFLLEICALLVVVNGAFVHTSRPDGRLGSP